MPETEVLYEKVSEETKGSKRQAIFRTRDYHQQASQEFSQPKFSNGFRKDSQRQDSGSPRSEHSPRLSEAYASARVLTPQEHHQGIC